MIPVDRDTSVQHNQFTKSMSLPATVDSDSEFDFSTHGDSSTSSASASSPTTVATTTTMPYVNDNILSPAEEDKKSIEDFLGKIDSNLAKTKKYVKNSQSSIDKLASIEDNDFQERTHSAAAYALASSSSSYQSGGYGGYSGNSSSSSNGGTQMVVTHGKRVKSSLHRLEEQQDEFFQL